MVTTGTESCQVGELGVCVCVTCAIGTESLQVREVQCVPLRVSDREVGGQVGVGDVGR